MCRTSKIIRPSQPHSTESTLLLHTKSVHTAQLLGVRRTCGHATAEWLSSKHSQIYPSTTPTLSPQLHYTNTTTTHPPSLSLSPVGQLGVYREPHTAEGRHGSDYTLAVHRGSCLAEEHRVKNPFIHKTSRLPALPCLAWPAGPTARLLSRGGFVWRLGPSFSSF